MIRIEGARKRYGAREILRGVELDVARGRVTAIVGPNGAGKTTLIKAILGLVRLDAGSIVVDGEAVRDDGDYRARIGYMPQLPRFPEKLTARELLALLAGLRSGAVTDGGLAPRLELESFLDRPLGTLSGGMRQRVNAVAAFMFRPDLLVLDEPTAGLDPVASSVLKDWVLAERAEGRTVIVTSHVMSEVEELADDVAFLLDGQVRFSGSVEALAALTGEQTLERAVASLMRTERAA